MNAGAVKPVATVGTTTTGAVLFVWLLGHFGVSVPAEAGAAICGAATMSAGAIWRYGLYGIVRRLVRGDPELEKPPALG